MVSDSSDDEGGRYNRYYTDDSDDNNEHDEDQTLELAIEKLKLGPKKNKLIVFGLNGMLIHRAHRRDKSKIPENRRPDGVYNNGNKLVYKRSFLYEFMKFCLERFEDQKQSTDTGFKALENKRKPLFLKELSKLHSHLANSSRGARFSESNTLLIDDDPVKSLCNLGHTGIFPDTYDPSDSHDNALDPKEELGKYLEGLANAEEDDVPTYVKANPFGQPAIGPDHPNWDFYSRVLRRLKN
uniref:Mitochondrial import inner membrane translocase subunit TIM50 n=1 Tax=Chenopodium quinoa TaxID=63459 RepID=A0A803MQP3_CHEQI